MEIYIKGKKIYDKENTRSKNYIKIKKKSKSRK